MIRIFWGVKNSIELRGILIFKKKLFCASECVLSENYSIFPDVGINIGHKVVTGVDSDRTGCKTIANYEDHNIEDEACIVHGILDLHVSEHED